jgi:peptidoglycan hydrolase-like protein with peptidoglycan-binding domain
VTKFQTEHGLAVDGWAGEATQNKLRDALAVLQH